MPATASERHRVARHRGCLLTSPHGCGHLAGPAWQPPHHGQVWPPQLPQTPPEASAGPGAFATGNTGTDPFGAQGALAPWGLPRRLTQTSPHRANNLTPFHRRGTVATEPPRLPGRNKGEASARAAIRAQALSQSHASFRNRSCVFLPFETLWDLYIASILSL